jgi:hypothetical protein
MDYSAVVVAEDIPEVCRIAKHIKIITLPEKNLYPFLLIDFPCDDPFDPERP